ncbi:hypothetical protein F1542_12150 [Komagataeibacter sp. FXV3]|nr:hypothetical protein [Komagataeibacter sp. FXV3]MBE7730493.1 hypothetical protein [Komagataeibacter sp. FXV3]
MDDDRYECRKIEIYGDGRFGIADETRPAGETWLADVKIPPLSEINKDEQFEATEISRTEFKKIWNGYSPGLDSGRHSA